ncbi:MAG TPA: transcription elongation protein SprT [Cytophagales bacterium]|nr:transcription elongation protein SprT [Cytophagales bacterium]
MDKTSEYLSIFSNYFPANTVNYCHSLWLQHRFKFVISPKRATKLGNYRFNSVLKQHQVSVNGNLNPMSFLTTYLHEVAHLTAFKKYGFKILPHGQEWKQEFRNLFLPLLSENILDKEAIVKLKAFLKNPRASSCSEQGLFGHEIDHIELKEGQAFLKDLPQGSHFQLKKRRFVKLEHRRTRILCSDKSNGRKYLVHQTTVVQLV